MSVDFDVKLRAHFWLNKRYTHDMQCVKVMGIIFKNGSIKFGNSTIRQFGNSAMWFN